MINSSNPSPSHEKGTSEGMAHQPGEGNGLMDVRGVAKYLSLDRQTIYNWLHQQKISGIKVGGVWRFERRAIDEWLKSRTVAALPNDSNAQKQPNLLPPRE